MIRYIRNLNESIAGWPRTSGDDPTGNAEHLYTLMLAPHERG